MKNIPGVSGFYSPVKHLQVTRLVEGPLLNGTKIAEISVLLNSSRPATGHLNFSSTKPTNLTVNSKGEVLVNGPIQPGVLENITVVAKMPHIPSVATVNISLLLIPTKDMCSQPSSEMCFVGRIHFQVHSDAKGLEHQVALGHIGPPVRSCKSLKAEYSLEKGEDRVWLRGDVLWLRTAALTVDLVPSEFNVTVGCSLGSATFRRTFRVDVMPRTPWETMKQKSVRLLSSTQVDKGGGFVVSWGFFKEGSRADLVQTSNTSVYNLRMDKKAISSVITNKTLFLIHLEWSSTRNISLPMTVEAKLQVSEPGFDKEEVVLQSTLQLTNSTFPNSTYAKPLEVAPGLTQYARSSYPANFKKWAQNPNVTFRSVLPSGLVSPFNVTRKGGVVYLTDRWRDFQQFYSNFTGVLVEWRLKSTKHVLQISWLPVEWKPANNSCHEDPYVHGEHDMAEFLCSAAMSKRACLQTCGLAASSSNGGVCSWVPLSRTQNYTTCSTDRGFCPDGFCDPLEQMVTHICPQDCTKYVHLGTLGGSGQGIAAASGHCTCDQLDNCECGTILPAPYNKNKVSEYPEDPRVNIQKASCDGSCIFLMVTVGTCILSLIMTSAFFCKKSRAICGAKNKSAMNYNSAYGAEALILTEMSTNELHRQIEIDEKWEISRSCLTVEECLGEGEFGRVLKGTARDLRGHPGYTTVAVKTLKDNAGSGELTDLLSEYQLLKKVDHKNVIKLLGACTSPGGPVYIIIEYCSLGSLRAYLRLHRNLKTNADMGANVPADSMITARDVLSFAYQISKGMAYLADMKLVHRDLAARNVLLAEGKVCKISDFGLTRDVYEDDTYLKQSRGRVPVKWMAIESLGDHVYTSQSDVWSFGIVLWELVTLGASPYPGVTVQNLYHLLKNGYRMQKPPNCTAELYEVMKACWHEKADDRPTFAGLQETFGRMLERGLDYVNFSLQMISNPLYFNPQDIQDDDGPGMNITFKMDLKAIKENNNRYENYSVGPDTSYDTPRPTDQVRLVSPTT